MNTEKPDVSVGQWIRVGSVDALVMTVHTDGSIAIGYYQNRTKAIKEDAIWDGAAWKLLRAGPNGTYLRGAEEAIVKAGPHRA